MQIASSSSKKSLKDELHILWDAGTNQSHLKQKHALTSVQKLGNRQADKLDVKNKNGHNEDKATTSVTVASDSSSKEKTKPENWI